MPDEMSAMTHDRIEINPDIRFGQPVTKGTRVPVTRLLAEIAEGASFAEISRQYDVSEEDIRAAIAFANELLVERSFGRVGA